VAPYVAGEPAGLILAAGLDRWIATFEDQEVAVLLQLMNTQTTESRTTLSAGAAG